jgi:hypothetical protein
MKTRAGLLAGWLPAAMLCLAWLAGCGAAPAPLPTPAPGLVVTPLYPQPGAELEMGQALRVIARVIDAQGHPVADGQLTVTVGGAEGGGALGAFEARSDSEGIYRGGPWLIPHRIAEGAYPLSLVVRRGAAAGEASGSVRIRASTGDALLSKYGFWLDAPALQGIVPQLVGEQGDARNGMIRWGGFLPSGHILPENWVDVQWRSGRYNLEDAAAVRRFMLETIGDLSFIPVRSIGPFEPFRFKGWNAWKVGGRGQVRQNRVEWVAFYAPETDKTYLIGTAVTLPPAGIDAHAALRGSFEVHPEIHADGVAPEPLPDLLPGPEPVGPPLGARFTGIDTPIILQWRPLKELAPDEAYRVSVDFNHDEGSTTAAFSTRDTQLTLPESLYRTPNCGVFNWEVTLVRQAEGADRADQPISRPSLYEYVEWRYPPGVQAPFTAACPNAQF